VKLTLSQDLPIGRLSVTLAENCHDDSTPLIDVVQFTRFHEAAVADTAALASAIMASRWCGSLLEVEGTRISPDFAEAIRIVVPSADFIQPIDGYRRHLCEGQLDLLLTPAASAASVLALKEPNGGLTRLLTWSGDFVEQQTRESGGYVAGEIGTNATWLLPDFEISVCLGLLVGGLRLRSITLARPDRDDTERFEEVRAALRIVGVQLRPVVIDRTAAPRPKAANDARLGGLHIAAAPASAAK
jgi:hypothetical protein